MSRTHNAAGQHALVVGGTGMLRRVALSLAEQGYTVSVIARRMGRLQSLVESASNGPGLIVPLSVDYRHDGQLRGALQESIERHGPVELTVCWIASSAANALRIVGETIVSTSNFCRLFQVRGSAAADPTRSPPPRPTWFEAHPRLHYRRVVLGFVVENGKSRWLTHEEISDGVMRAIAEDAPHHIIGTVEPWSLRPPHA